jgi:hypothetical protein
MRSPFRRQATGVGRMVLVFPIHVTRDGAPRAFLCPPEDTPAEPTIEDAVPAHIARNPQTRTPELRGSGDVCVVLRRKVP